MSYCFLCFVKYFTILEAIVVDVESVFVAFAISINIVPLFRVFLRVRVE